MEQEKLQALLKQIEQWHDDNEFSQIIKAIDDLPSDERTPELISQQARAYNNLAVMGDGMTKRENPEIDQAQLEKAVELLQSVAEQSQDNYIWHFRLGYALYFLDREMEALDCFERSRELNPDQDDVDDFIDNCRRILSRKAEDAPEVYTQTEWDVVEDHINTYFGEYLKVFHEITSPDIHVDICLVPPTRERPYYTLVTLGMGAHRMNVPSELADKKLERAELLIALPAEWRLDRESMQDENWYWPIRLLKSSARLPITNDTWLGWGHTIGLNAGETYADNTKFCGAMLTGPLGCTDGAAWCTLPDGDDVNFYQLTPLYEEEIEFKCSNGAEPLLDMFNAANVEYVVDIKRANLLHESPGTDPDEQLLYNYGPLVMDCALPHLDAIRDKKLPVREICAYNHLAIYLRWCIEHDLMSDIFKRKYRKFVNGVVANQGRPDEQPDLRWLLRNNTDLNGSLLRNYFNGDGAAFAEWYYSSEDYDRSHYFPCDIDNHAREFFGEERYNSEEFQDEAYLFVPWNEDYYQAMARQIDRQFARWQEEAENQPEDDE